MRANWNIRLLVSLAFLLPSSPNGLAAAAERYGYFTQIVQGTGGKLAAATVFHFTNTTAEEISSILEFFNAGGLPWEPQVAYREPSDREVEIDANSIRFRLPPRAALQLGILSPANLSNGWARYTNPLALKAFARLQVASAPYDDPLALEHTLSHEAVIHPTLEGKRFSFPLDLFLGFQEIRTAFAVVNLSGAPAPVRFTRRPDDVKTVTMAPGQLISHYLDRFWSFAVIEIFPLKLAGMADIESQAPLATTVYRTLGGLPLSGIPVARQQTSKEPLQATLDTDFELGMDETAAIASEELQVTFWNLTEDSRCPIDVVCVWEGQATIVVRVTKNTQKLGGCRLTHRAGHPELSTAEVGDYRIQLVEVEPAPVSAPRLEASQYRVTLRVSRK